MAELANEENARLALRDVDGKDYDGTSVVDDVAASLVAIGSTMFSMATRNSGPW